MAREISEHDATLAVDAAAKAAYEDFVKSHHAQSNEGPFFPTWELLEPATQLKFRQSVLNFVWAALGALPDQRRAAWFEGYSKGCHDEQTESWTTENPYPAEEA